jgi:hypothetical protein
MAVRRKRKARSVAEKEGFLIQFIPGGFYHFIDGRLFTGVRRAPAGETIKEKLMPLAKLSVEHQGQWVTLPHGRPAPSNK